MPSPSQGHTPSLPEPREVTGKSGVDNGIRRRAGGARSPRPPPPPAAGPSQKRPAKLEAIREPQVPRVLRGARDRSPHPPAQRRVLRRVRSWREVSCGARRPIGGSGGLRVGSSGRARAAGDAPSHPSLSPSSAPPLTPGTYGGRGPRTRRSLAGGGGSGRGGAPVAELRKRSRVAVGRGTARRRAGLSGKGRANRQTPPRGWTREEPGLRREAGRAGRRAGSLSTQANGTGGKASAAYCE